MEEAWFTQIADEFARCLTDARKCAEACEALLASVSALEDEELQRRVVDAVVGAAAVSRVLFELVDQPRPLVLAAARLCRESAEAAVPKLEALGASIDAAAAITALRAGARSCDALLRT